VRTALKLAVLPLALAAAAFASVLSPAAGAAAPPADITGSYDGKFNFKYYPLTEANVPDHGKIPCSMAVTFNDPMLSITVSIQTEFGPKVYNLQGRYGLGRFWATGNGLGGQMALSGTVAGVAGKLKLAGGGTVTAVDSLQTFKAVMKELPPL